MSDEETLTETLEALESAKRLVDQLQERVDILSMGELGDLKKIANALHKEECRKGHSGDAANEMYCPWHDEAKQQEPFFGAAHKRWLETAQYRVRASARTAEAFLDAVETVMYAKESSRW